MSSHASAVSSFLSIGMVSLTTLILWSRIHLVSRTLAIPESERRKASLFSAIFLFGWLLLSLALALLDFYHVTPQLVSPLVPIGFALPIAAGFYLMRNSSTFQKIIDAFPQNWLMLLQLPRVVGVIFLLLYQQGLLPGLFAIPSGVGDLIVGLSAPLVAHFHSKREAWSHNLAIAWNVVGIVDLLVAIGVGILLALPPRYSLVSTTPSTELMTVFPLVLIPVFAVPLGLLLHVFSLRLLLKKNQATGRAR